MSDEAQKSTRPTSAPSVFLCCPECGARHVDAGEWATRIHRNHLCLKCGHVFTIGIYCLGKAGPFNERQYGDGVTFRPCGWEAEIPDGSIVISTTALGLHWRIRWDDRHRDRPDGYIEDNDFNEAVKAAVQAAGVRS